MFDLRFFATRLGNAALVSIAAMTAFVVLSVQNPTTALASPMIAHHQAALA